MKYIIKFKKEGKIRFISHLDLQKVFLRLFRIIGIKPRYSNGFNPHPKLSFALPLSLGFASGAEYLELETEIEFDPEYIVAKLTEYLPPGLKIEFIYRKPEKINKKLASYVDCAEYEVVCPYFNNPKENIKKFLKQEKIIYEKTNRKSGKIKNIDIKPMIHELKFNGSDNNNIMLLSLLHAGNDSVLNPNVLTKSLYSFMNETVETSELIIYRKRVFCYFDDEIINVDKLFAG